MNRALSLGDVEAFDKKNVKSCITILESLIAARLAAAREKYGREIRVFETSIASATHNNVSDAEVTDDFYEFTPEDYYRILATKKEDKHLKTKKIRDAEDAARRARITKAVIRVRFPDNHTLEVTFHPSETIQSLVDLLNKVVAHPEMPFYLYTTPPKKQLKDMSQDFYSADFLPGAIVYFACDVPKGDNEAPFAGCFLQEDDMSLQGLEFIAQQSEPVSQPAPEPVTTGPSVVPERKPADKKNIKPKWLKMIEVACNHNESVGFSTDGFGTLTIMRKLHLIWVTARMRIEIYKYPAWGDHVVEVETWYQNEGRIGPRRDWFLKDFATGEVIGRATRSKWVTNQDTRRLQKVNDDVRNEYIAFSPKTLGLTFPEENNGSLKEIAKLNDPAQYSKVGLVPRRDDLDMNHHVNNVAYIGWVLESRLSKQSVPKEIIDSHEVQTITLEYRRECQQDDVVDCLTAPENAFSELRGINGSPPVGKDLHRQNSDNILGAQ
ncbi:Plant UBX domain-containing protein 1 [Castilleja foliolosa]|uniref:Acyl-[acyl-carrier-protein] hydrolase n=1 Tax=Castilleja foliolosa TaxID=1961234 RepID=A0ABD3ELU6_9LAMI